MPARGSIASAMLRGTDPSERTRCHVAVAARIATATRETTSTG